jgi:hypothetical protein
VRTDNEKNASLCIKMIIDIVPHQTNVLGDKFQPSLALIQHMFDQIQLVVMGSHNSMPGISPPGSSHTHEDSPQPGSSVASISDFGLGLQLQTLPLLQAMASLKVLAECPESRIQVYKSLVSMDIKRFFLFIQSVLLLQAKPQEQDHVAAAAKGTIFTEVSLNTSSRPAFGEFIRTRVKALSTLACLLQYYGEQLLKLTEFKKFHLTLPPTIIQQLKDCPREKSGVRRELFMTTRHIINHKFRKLFLKHIDELLDERTLIGDGLTDYETQRPLAYSIIADLIHHVRDALKPPQIRKTVEVYTKNLQDNFPGTSFQTMSAKLLLNMAECIAKMPNKVDARYYLILILNAIGNKFASIKQQHSNAIKLSKLYAQQSVDVSPYNYLAEKEPLPDWDEIDIFTATPIKTSNPLDRGADPVADNKFLFQNLINGLKDIFHQLKACQIGSSTRFTAEEVQVLSKLFCEGANVFCYYEINKPGTESHYTNALELVADRYVFSTGEEKDLLQTFIAVLQYIDPTTLHEIFHDQISIALSRVPQLSEIFPTLVEQYRLQQFFRAEEWVDYLISVADIGDEWCDIRPLLSIIDAVLDNIYTIRNDAILARLYKYLNCFPKEVYSLLFSKIDEQKYGRFFAQLLQHPKSGPLRKVVAENVETMIKNSGDKSAEEDTRYTAQVYSIHIMYSVCKFEGDREWLDKKDVIMWFKMVGKNLEAHLRSNTLPPHLRLAAEQASEPLMVIFTKFLEYHPTDLDALFSLIDSVTNEDFSSTQPLSAYIYRHIICSNSIEYRKTIVLRSLEVCASKSASQKTKTFVLHNIVNAIIAMDVMRPSKQIGTKSPRLIDKAVIESIHIKFWKVGLGNSNDDLTQSSVEFTIMELLQLTAMLVKYYHSALQDTWQDIIKLGLTCLEDVVCKHAANVVLGYCIAHFETPTQTIRQVYTSLLGSSHHGGRALVTQALELIAPVLRNLYNAVPNDRNPFWVAIPLKILEGKDIQQTTTFFRFLVKHPDLFYDFRKSFIIYIVKSLRTIAQLPNPPNQSMQLVLQLMTLVLQWEQQRVEGRKFLSTEKHKFEDLGEQLSLLRLCQCFAQP